MSELPKISDAEWEVMRVVWQQSPLTATEIITKLSKQHSWKPKTIKTLITRLVQKTALSYEQRNRVYAYYPVVSEQECVKAESHSFLKRIYGGSLKPMFVHFLEQEKLTAEDIQELKDLLKEKGE